MSKNSPLQRIKALNDWWFMFNRSRKYKPKPRKKVKLEDINNEGDED